MAEDRFELTDEQEQEMRRELEAALREWAANHPSAPGSLLTNGVPNEWLLDYGELEAGTWGRFLTDEDSPSKIGSEWADIAAMKGDGDRGVHRRVLMKRLLSILREAVYPLQLHEIAQRLGQWFPPEDMPSRASLKRYLKLLCELDFARTAGQNPNQVYVAGDAKALRPRS